MHSLKTKIITLAFSALAAAPLAAHGPQKKAPHPAVSMKAARKAALAAVPGGTVQHGVYEYEAGQWIYDIDVATSSVPEGVREVWVDPKSGKVLKNVAKPKADQLADAKADEKTESPAQKKAELKAEEKGETKAQERTEAAKMPKPAVSLEQARTTALGAVPGGKVKSGEFEKEAGQWIYSFDISTVKGIREVWVDAQSGKVIKNEAESKAQEKKEAVQEKSEPAH